MLYACAIFLPLSFVGMTVVGVVTKIRIFADWSAVVAPTIALIVHNRFRPAASRRSSWTYDDCVMAGTLGMAVATNAPGQESSSAVRMRFFQCEAMNQRMPARRTSSTPRWKRWKMALKRGSLFHCAPSFIPT
jgi:hypothetical protein